MKKFIELITGNREGNRFYKIITNWAYSWPAWIYATFQLRRAKNQMRGPLSWPLRACIIMASLLLADGKWWGCFFGFTYGIYGVCEELCKLATGQHIFFSGIPLSVGIIIYYGLMAYLVYRKSKKQG